MRSSVAWAQIEKTRSWDFILSHYFLFRGVEWFAFFVSLCFFLILFIQPPLSPTNQVVFYYTINHPENCFATTNTKHPEQQYADISSNFPPFTFPIFVKGGQCLSWRTSEEMSGTKVLLSWAGKHRWEKVWVASSELRWNSKIVWGWTTEMLDKSIYRWAKRGGMYTIFYSEISLLTTLSWLG